MRSLKQRFHFERKFSNLGRLAGIRNSLIQISRCSSLTHWERTGLINAEKCVDKVLMNWRNPHNELLAFQSFERENK
ncbi:MAG TPA: hypothetical protein VMW36_07230 [Patescibacteria group bacterium]|nr:hypothetical protein [Patescibacteria group bacterium]